MTYLALSGWFVAAAIALALLFTVTNKKARAHRGAIAITLLILVALTAAFDSVMISADLFHYAPSLLAGMHIGIAPIEDFAYPIAGALLLPALWALLRSRLRAPHSRKAAHKEDE